MSVLIAAVESERMYQIKILLQRADVDVNYTDKNGQTAMFKACLMKVPWKAVATIKMLMYHGINLKILDRWNRTCLSYACIKGEDDLVNILLGTGDIDPNTRDTTGYTNLMHGVLSGNERLVVKLVYYLHKYNLTLDDRTSDGFTAYMLAMKEGFFSMATIFKENGASTETFDFKYYRKSDDWAKRCRTAPNPRLLQNRSRLQGMRRTRSLMEPEFLSLEKRCDFVFHDTRTRSTNTKQIIQMLGVKDKSKGASRDKVNDQNLVKKTSNLNSCDIDPPKHQEDMLNLRCSVSRLEMHSVIGTLLEESALTKVDNDGRRSRNERAHSSRQNFRMSPASFYPPYNDEDETLTEISFFTNKTQKRVPSSNKKRTKNSVKNTHNMNGR